MLSMDFFSAFIVKKLTASIDNFQVRFFYSFTCRDNLYLVMEYLNGGDMYSMLRNLGCLEESLARVYVAELVRCPVLDCNFLSLQKCVLDVLGLLIRLTRNTTCLYYISELRLLHIISVG